MEIIIKVEDTDNAHLKRFSYTPKIRGEGVFLMKKCKEQGIKAFRYHQNICIQAKTKLEKFKELIKETLQEYKICTKQHKTKVLVKDKNKVICVIIEECIYVTESSMEDLIIKQYKGEIPYLDSYKIFHTYKEMEEALLEKGILI